MSLYLPHKGEVSPGLLGFCPHAATWDTQMTMNQGRGWAAVDPLPAASVTYWLSLLRLPSQCSIAWHIHSRNLSHSSGDWKSKVKVWTDSASDVDPLPVVEGEEQPGAAF